jgi:hypothetical protein
MAHKVSLRDLARPFDIRGPGLPSDPVGKRQTKLRGFFDGEDPLIGRDEGGDSVQQARLA